MSKQLNSRSAGLVAVSLAWAIFLTIIGSPEVLLFTVPLFMLAAPLALGRYFGEDVVHRLARLRHVPPRTAPTESGPQRRAPIVLGRGGEILSSGLAGRGPPLSA